jgi:hypothetical protein
VPRFAKEKCGRNLVLEHVFDYHGGMTWIPAPLGEPDEAPGDDAGVGREMDAGFDDASTSAGAAALLEAVDALAAGETWRCSEADLGRLVQTVEVAQRRLDMVAAAAAVQAHQRGVAAESGFTTAGAGPDATVRSIAGWLRSLVNISPYQAKARATAAVALLADPRLSPELAETCAAAQCGQISTRHAVVIADTIAKLSPPHTPDAVVDANTRADAQRVLLAHAAVLDPTQTRVLATRTLAVLDPDAGDRLAHDEDTRDQLRGLTLARQASGLVHLSGTLTPDCAGLLTTAIDTAAAPRPASDGTRDTRTPAMRRHDGLAHVLAQAVAADGLLPSTHGSPHRLVVTVPHATLTAELHRRTGQRSARRSTGWDSEAAATGSTAQATGRSGEGPEVPAAFRSSQPRDNPQASEGARELQPVQPGLLPDGWPLSPLTVQTLACTADLVPILVDDDHQPLDVGDTQYAFPPKIRTAIITRDTCCTYPGCGAPAPWCDVHHLIRFRDRGPTSVTNGALLCGRHHRYVHALALTGRVESRDGTSRVVWDHRPTSWTATTATRATSATGADGTSPPLTDPCLDQLVRRWLRRHMHQGDVAA